MHYPKISIVTPSFNQGNYIEETILSILNQNYPNLEYIIIDGGSTDQTIEIIKKYEKHLKFWVSEKDKGQANAINKGLKQVTGDIFNWINSDDILYEGALFNIANSYNQNVDLICGKVLNFSEFGNLEIVENKDLNFENFVTGNCNWHQPGIWFNCNKYKNILVDESLNFCFDFLLISKVLSNQRLYIKTVDKILVKFRIHNFSKTGSGSKSYFENMNTILGNFLLDTNLIKYHKRIRMYLFNINRNLHSNYFINSILLSNFSRSYKIFTLLAHYFKNIRYCSNRYYLGNLKNLILLKNV